jgi:hypothetical protein
VVEVLNEQEIALGSVYYELLSVLQLLGVLALQEANTCLTPRAPAEGYSPKVTEGMLFFCSSFGQYLSYVLYFKRGGQLE